MLEGFAPSHPSSWTAQDLVEAGTATDLPYTTSRILPGATSDLAARTWLPIDSSDGGRSRKAAEQTPANLSISLDFLQQAEDDLETEEDLRRGRPGPRQIRAYSHLTHLSSNQNQNRSSFGESPETDSPFGSEQEWRRSLAAEADPIYKTGHRSSSRDPPGLPRRTGSSAAPAPVNGQRSHLFSGISPPFESSSPSSLSSFGGRVAAESIERSSVSRDRPASISRSHSLQNADPQISSSSPFRPAGINIHPSSDGHRLNRLQAEHKSNLTRSLSHERSQGSPSPLHRSLSVNDPATATANTHVMSTSPDRNRPPLQASHSGLPTMHEEIGHGEEHYTSLGDRGQSDFRTSARHRSTSSAAALQHDDRGSLAGGTRNGADPFHRSVSLWRGEMGGMSPGTYASRAFSQDQQPHYTGFSQQSPPTIFSSPPSQWDRGRRPDYAGAAFEAAFAEDDLLRSSVPGGGTESRRHTIAAGDQGGEGAVPSGQRRAIGFEVGRPGPSSSVTSRTSSVGRQTATPRASAPLPGGLFSGGGLAITEDELTTDLQSLRLNLDDVALQRQQQQQLQEDRRRNSGMRVPSSAAAMSGIHASSVPSGLGAPDFANFGQSPPMGGGRLAGGVGGHWPVSARLGDEDSSSTWSDLHPSPSNKSTFTEYSQGFQQTHQQQQQPLLSRSPGLGGEDRKTSLSASAKAFAAPYAAHSSPVSSRQTSRDMAPGFVPSPPSAQARGPLGGQPLQQQHSSSSRSKSSSSPSMSAGAILSEGAIASLVTLGPLAPASGGGPSEGAGSLQELGKGVPLQMLPRSTTLYIVEFKEGRTDLYFRQPQGSAITEEIHKGDLVIVEADRGKDLGTVVNQSITVEQVQTFLAQQAELAAQQAAAVPPSNPTAADQQPHPAAVSLSRLSRSMNPKRLFAKAGPADTSLLHSKAQDEERALTLCTTKVNQRGLPMTVVAAELQWDRRKLTFYYTATQRVDFRDLVKELFRLYKTRIWMCHLSHPSGSGLPA